MKANENATAVGGLAGWLLGRLKGRGRRQSRLELVERIALAPRQSLALVEAEGRRFLVATSPEGAPAFYALDERISPRPIGARQDVSRQRIVTNRQTGPAARISW
jgi:flagellar biogenesis protein FliO